MTIENMQFEFSPRGNPSDPTGKESLIESVPARRQSGLGSGRLYAEPVAARRAGPLYNAFSYPTKIDPEAIALFIAAHTLPGDTVLDVFAGSGTTGLAVRLCENPTNEMVRRARELEIPAVWGPRTAILYELSVVGSLLAQTLCNPPNPSEFAMSARRLVTTATEEFGWIYEAEAPGQTTGSLRHAIWSEELICPACQGQMSFWDLAVSRKPLALLKHAVCHTCRVSIAISDAARATEVVTDPITGEAKVQRIRRLAYVYGRSGRATWQREPIESDFKLIDRVLEEPIPACVPSSAIHWGDLYRSGYHQGIDHFHQFYTQRNLIALGALWERIESEPQHLRDALRLLVLSYNAAHSTLMTRIVVKKGMSDFVLTGAQPGVLYVSSLPVEKNVFDGVKRKIDIFRDAFAATDANQSTVRVVNATSTQLDLLDRSIDYVFTDPPFGGFIPYAEINQINEAWLGRLTDKSNEAIVSPAQNKGVVEYASLMKQVFSEVARTMKDDAAATVIFHSSKPEVWEALGDALTSAGLAIDRTSVLDKTQMTFKQVVSKGSTRGDAIFLLSRGATSHARALDGDLHATITELQKRHGVGTTPQHLYSRYVAHCVETGLQVKVSSNDFYAELNLVQEGIR